jgi:RNA polymerase sigma-70 factor (ECF subfamily)
LSSCLHKLGLDQRQLVLKRYTPGASVTSIAAEQQKSPKAVSESLRRIRALLFDCIERTIAREARA